MVYFGSEIRLALGGIDLPKRQVRSNQPGLEADRLLKEKDTFRKALLLKANGA